MLDEFVRLIDADDGVALVKLLRLDHRVDPLDQSGCGDCQAIFIAWTSEVTEFNDGDIGIRPDLARAIKDHAVIADGKHAHGGGKLSADSPLILAVFFAVF